MFLSILLLIIIQAIRVDKCRVTNHLTVIYAYEQRFKGKPIIPDGRLTLSNNIYQNETLRLTTRWQTTQRKCEIDFWIIQMAFYHFHWELPNSKRCHLHWILFVPRRIDHFVYVYLIYHIISSQKRQESKSRNRCTQYLDKVNKIRIYLKYEWKTVKKS